MKTCFHLWSLGLGVLAACPVLSAQPLPWPADTAPAESVLKKATRLVREDARVAQGKRPASGEQGAKSGEPSLAPVDASAGIVVLEPMIVTEKKTPAIPPPLHETRAQEFFRTGTIWKRIGRKFTTEFWVHGDQGIGFTFSW